MSSKHFLVSRRSLLKSGAAVALAAPALVRSANAQSAFDWKQFNGQTVNTLWSRTSRSESIQKLEKSFTEMTGINVSSEILPEQQQRQKLVIEFTSGQPSFDVVAFPLQQKRQGIKGNWLANMKPMIDNAQITSPDFRLSNYSEYPVAFATEPNGNIFTFPIALEYMLLYYNKELFDAKGVAYPQTLEDIYTAAKALNQPDKNVAGYVSRGLKNANAVVWGNYILGQNIEAIDASGKLLTDTPEAIWAADLYARLNRDTAPPGTIGFNWNECQTTFAQGRAAMWCDVASFGVPLQDPTKSRVVGKVGYGVMPKGPKAHHTAAHGETIAISEMSKVKGPAWLYVQWILGKQIQDHLLQTGRGVPSLRSPFTDPQVIETATVHKDWITCMQQSAPIARQGLPVITPINEFRDVFGVALTNMISGADPATEMRNATQAFRPILEKSL